MSFTFVNLSVFRAGSMPAAQLVNTSDVVHCTSLAQSWAWVRGARSALLSPPEVIHPVNDALTLILRNSSSMVSRLFSE